MDYEQKYKKALERAREELGSGCFDRGTIEYIFPELKESEDERIRQAIIDTLKGYRNLGSTNGVLKENMIAWLEKQGEQKPKWTEEDEIGSDATIELLEYFINYAPEFRKPTIRRSIDWLKSLKQRMEEQQ